jgi:hypothetical protein
MHFRQAAFVARVRWWEGGGEAENLEGEQDVDTGASSNSTTVSVTNKTQKDMIQRKGGEEESSSIAGGHHVD